jgi:putative lipoic acid-binding regulatory protein
VPVNDLLRFPCDYPIKVMGRRQDGFAQAVLEVVLRHAPDFDAAAMTLRPSAQRNYIGLTCIIRAVSRAQLDALYRDLTALPFVKVVL